MAKKIVLATIGSLGDLHPFIAIGLELDLLGFEVVLAVSADQVEKVRASGLEAHAILPPDEQMNADLGMSPEEAAKAVIEDVNFVIDKILLGYLREGVEALDEIASDACAIVGTMLAFPAPIISEKREIPYIHAALQPMSLITVHHVPKSPDYWMLASKKFGVAGRIWNRMWLPLIRSELKRRYAKRINKVRQEQGLGKIRRAPFIEVEVDPIATLALYSPELASLQPDYPENTALTGFPVFDSNGGTPETLDTDFQEFLSAGSAPLVFSLGSFAINAPGKFYEDSFEVANALGQRAILLTGGDTSLKSTGDILVRRYAPYSQLFPHAAAIIHHGGIGTTGQAMRAGKPQLVVPHLGDQWDNGERVKALGIGDVLEAKKYTESSAQNMIATLIANNEMRDLALVIGKKITKEDGAETAAKAIADAIAGTEASVS